jgi:hypothetical protein
MAADLIISKAKDKRLKVAIPTGSQNQNPALWAITMVQEAMVNSQ